jgi:hypothetical protein
MTVSIRVIYSKIFSESRMAKATDLNANLLAGI